MSRACSDCEKPITRHSKTGRCQDCSNRARRRTPIKHCAGCSKKLSSRTAGGLCRSCFNRDPAKRAATSVALKALCSLPEHRARLVALGHENYHRGIGRPDVKAITYTPELIASRAKSASETKLKKVGVPAEYRERYLPLMRRFGAELARQVILAQIETDKARAARAREAASPFERQMEALNRGAGLTAKLNLASRDYDFTLGGVSELGA